MATTSTVPDRDELRIALALNGGVSLAVWMGGSIQELDDLRCADVETPGGAHGSRIVYEKLLEALDLQVRVDIAAATSAGGMNGPLLAVAAANGSRLEGLRDLWMTVADFGGLLRSPADPEPPSLLDGDGYALSHIKERLDQQFAVRPERQPQRFRLILTGTDIQGVRIAPIPDSYGAELPRVEHRLQFRFAGSGAPNDPPPDGWLPLAAPSAPELARAARTSSSFPFAFEPSKITEAEFAGGLWTRRGGRLQLAEGAHRWAIDGGVLDNSPVQPVLNEIWATPTANRPQRRCIVFVTPYSTESVAEPPPNATLSQVLGATLNVPRDVPYIDDLARLADYIRRQHQTRDTDESLLRLSDETLETLAKTVWTPSARTRVEHEVRESARRLGATPTPAELEEATKTVVEGLEADIAPDWIPWGGVDVRAVALRWRTRLAAARRLLPAGSAAKRDVLRKQETAIQLAIVQARDAESGLDPPPDGPVAGRIAADVKARTSPVPVNDVDGVAAPAGPPIWGDAVDAVVAAIDGARAALKGTGYAKARAALGADASVTPKRLLLVEAILWSLAPPADEDARPGLEVEFLRLSTSGLDEVTGTPFSYGYLYGAQLGHFGGFIRASWRAHDWMIGRLDGATAIMDLLLNRRRIAESGLTNADLKRLLTAVSAGADLDGDLPSTRAAPSDEELGSWKTAFTRLAHSLILCEELPQVGAAVAGEVKQDWSKSTPAPQGDITLANARAAFGTYLGSIAQAGGTKEVVTAEFGSPKGSRLVADAGVVATTVLGSDRTGFPGFVSMAVGAARGAVRVAGFAVHQATGGRLQRSVFIGVTALAGAALAWAVAKSGSTSTGAAPAGGSSFKESVVAASLTILAVAVVLGLRPFASRALSMICGLATAIAFSLMVGWLWTGKARPSCDLNTPCGTLGNTDFVWLVLGVVALSVAVGWVATVSLSARLQSLVSVAVVAYAIGIAVVLKA